jgi:hypothetical protein
MIAVLAALALAAAPGGAVDLAGLYETAQMEVAAALELQPNGHFRYALEYGAVSERGEGDWTFDGKAVHLTSNPMPAELHALELGNARFDYEPLIVEDGDLFLARYETIFRFRRVEP